MKKFDFSSFCVSLAAIAFVGAIICFGVYLARGGNGHNSLGAPLDCVEWFEDTGIDVKNQQGRVYNIVKDQNGFLYYCSDVEGTLCLVLDENGEPTKSVELFG